MMNAKEAFTKTRNAEIAIEKDKKAKVMEFVNTQCAGAQAREMEVRPTSYSAGVDIPSDVDASAVEVELKKMGYETHIRWGMPNRLTFCWRHVQ